MISWLRYKNESFFSLFCGADFGEPPGVAWWFTTFSPYIIFI